MQGLIAKMTKKGKKDKRKLTSVGAEVSGSGGASSTSSLLRPVVMGGHDREEHRTDDKGREVSQRNPHPDVEVAVQSGLSREGSDVDGKKPDRLTDPPDPPLSIPPTSHRGGSESTWERLMQLLLLIISPDNADDPAVPDHVLEEALGSDQSEPDNTGERGSDWKSTASAAAKLLLRGVRDSADAFGPLKSVAGGLCFILENSEVRHSSPIHDPQHLQVLQRMKANKEAIGSLAPRIKSLSALLREDSGEDVMEQSRRGKFER